MSKMIRKTSHPSLDLTLQVYSKRAFFQKAWNENTINSRGHVYDSEGNLVSCPFPKFFNIGEHPSTNYSHVVELMSKHVLEAKLYTKYNGHLAILFNYDGEWINTTKGSFVHEFIEPDRQLIRKVGFTDKMLAKFPSHWTFMFEIVGDHDPHLMTEAHKQEYKGETAILLGIYDNHEQKTVVEWEDEVWQVFDQAGYDEDDMPPTALFVPLDDIMESTSTTEAEYWLSRWKHDTTNTEGYILYIPSLDYRVKIKTDWFIKHRYMFQFNHERTQKIFRQYFDSEQAFVKIPEELHAEYQDIIGDYLIFEAKYKETMMDSARNILQRYRTKHEMVDFILKTDEIKTELEKDTMIAYLTNQPGYEALLREVFAVKYQQFSLVERTQLEAAIC